MWPKTRRACLRACLRRDVLGRQADTHRQATDANPWIRGGSACLLQAGNAVFRSQGPDIARMDFINGLLRVGCGASPPGARRRVGVFHAC